MKATFLLFQDSFLHLSIKMHENLRRPLLENFLVAHIRQSSELACLRLGVDDHRDDELFDHGGVVVGEELGLVEVEDDVDVFDVADAHRRVLAV